MGIIDTIREYQNKPNDLFLRSICFLLLFILILVGYYIFFFNPATILNYIYFPLIFIYFILFSFVLYFIFNRMKEKSPLMNIGFEMNTHAFSFGKLIILVISMFLAFYIAYNTIVSILIATSKVSIIFTVAILIVILAIINSYTKMYDTDVPNIYIDFIKDLIFYIPCLLTDFIDFIKQDYKNTPSTTIILFIVLVIICFLYMGISVITFNDPLLLIDSPVYLNTHIISYNRNELSDIIIQSRPWYERELLRIQNIQIGSNLTKTTADISNTFQQEIDFLHKINLLPKEAFTSVIASEIFPSHLNISEYDKYVIKQAMYNNSKIIDQINDLSGNTQSEFVRMIIYQQKHLMGIYEWVLLHLALYNSSNLSKSIFGDIFSNTYHYGISFWVFLNPPQSITGKDIIFQYGTRPSMYYNHDTKELSLEITDVNSKNTILYQTSNILYQRWNHIIMNYNYGTFDLFINNNLVSTNTNIVKQIATDELFQVGFLTNNNLGGISKMKYSEEPYQLNQIERLYINPPKI